MENLKKNNINAFAYADDLAMVGRCKTNLLEAIDIVEEWADNNIIINKKKSGIMIHKTRGKAAKEDKGFLREFPYKSEYKYLGIIIDRNLTLRNHLNNLKSKVEKG